MRWHQKRADIFPVLPTLAPGACYRFRVNDKFYPDPASRFQPDGPHGPSCIVDPAGFGGPIRTGRELS